MAKVPPGVGGFPIGHGPNRRRAPARKGCGRRAAVILAIMAAGTYAAVWLGWRVAVALMG